jgi:hypothetical protein
MEHLVGENSDGNLKRGKIEVTWRFVEESEIPSGPWLEEKSINSVNYNRINFETNTLRTD